MLIRIDILIICMLLSTLIFNNFSSAEELSYSDIVYVGGSGPGNYSNIQKAINYVNFGGTVFVYNGTYYEYNIAIYKKINLIGEDKTSTVIDTLGAKKGIEIFYDDVVVKGFTIRNNSYKFDWWYNSLIEVNKSSNITIKDNIIINDYDVINNDNHVCGVCLIDSTNCFLQNNNFYGCNILIFYLDHFDFDDSNLKYFFHNIDTSNKVNGKTIYYYKNCSNIDVPSDAGQIIFINTTSSKIIGMNNSNVSFNVQLFYSDNNVVEDNNINNSLSGFWLHHSNFNIFKNNSVNTTSCSLLLWHSNNNFFQNNILPSITIEQYSNHNVFIKNHIRSSRTQNFSLQLESSDFNVFICNNIFGSNMILGIILKNVTAVRMYNSHHNFWDENYWDNWIGLKNNFFIKNFPKIIVGFHRGIYVPFNRFNFPSYVNFDLNPVDEPYII